MDFVRLKACVKVVSYSAKELHYTREAKIQRENIISAIGQL